MSTSELDYQLVDAFWDRLVVGRIGYPEMTQLVGHIFVGPKAQSFVASANRLSLGAIGSNPTGLDDSVVWDSLGNLFYQYDPALMGRYTSADSFRYGLCRQDNLQCQVFNLFTLLLAQLAVSEGSQAIYRSNFVTSLIGGGGLDINHYKMHFRYVCMFYMEVFSE